MRTMWRLIVQFVHTVGLGPLAAAAAYAMLAGVSLMAFGQATPPAAPASATVLDQESLVPLGVAVTVGLFIAGIGIRLVTLVNTVKGEIRTLKEERQQMWTQKDQEIFRLRLQLNNPDLNVPDVPPTHRRQEKRT